MARTPSSFITRAKGLVAPPVARIYGGHTVLFLVTDRTDSFNSGLVGSLPASLVAAGCRLITLDLPAHGSDLTPGVQPLNEWRNRIAAGNTTLFTNFAAAVSRLIDSERLTDVTVFGQSRGGYVAAYCAAVDSRIKRMMMAAPVTNLQRLTEFDGYTVNQSTFGLGQFTAALSAKPIYIRMYATDTRVGTDAAQSFATAVGATIDLVAGSGHVAPDSGQMAAWLLSKVPLA